MNDTNYYAEQYRAQRTLERLVNLLRKDMNGQLQNSYATEKLQRLAAVYVPAQLALLEILKEGNEVEQDE
ncbi:MAG: hypothetical protein LUG23_01970 [Oscillospiraceae bacterium]|nr:hypothetical protein [Oscillospiraceae bacterium]